MIIFVTIQPHSHDCMSARFFQISGNYCTTRKKIGKFWKGVTVVSKLLENY